MLELGTAALVEKVLNIYGIERVIPRVHNRADAVHAIQELDLSAG